jgi:anti-sigma regulatory factor (Ser/Thr protein kinase)
VLLARFVGRDAAAKMGLPPAVLTRLSTVISEISRNVVQHAGCAGDIQIGQIVEGKRIGLRIIVSDKGKGIDRPERFLADGKVSALGGCLAPAD